MGSTMKSKTNTRKYGRTATSSRGRNRERGTTILEVVVAAAILLVVAVGVLSLFALSAGVNASQGDIATHCTEHTADFLDSLMTLAFNDATYLGGNMAANTTVGGVTSGSPVSGYVQYLDVTGAPATASTAYYVRQWQVRTNSSGNLKTMTVVTRANSNASGRGVAPSSSLVAVKANF